MMAAKPAQQPLYKDKGDTRQKNFTASLDTGLQLLHTLLEISEPTHNG